MWTLISLLLHIRDDDNDDQDDFVFEEFVRLRVAGIEENNETDA